MVHSISFTNSIYRGLKSTHTVSIHIDHVESAKSKQRHLTSKNRCGCKVKFTVALQKQPWSYVLSRIPGARINRDATGQEDSVRTGKHVQLLARTPGSVPDLYTVTRLARIIGLVRK